MIRKLATFGPAVVLALITFAFAAPPARAATNVVTCTPTAGLKSVVTVSPPMVNNASPDAKYGLKLKTTIDGCVGNAAQLTLWAPSKLGGTANGASIAKADVHLNVKGFGTCSLVSPDADAYPASGKLLVKWLDASGKAVPKTTPSSAYVRVSGNLAGVAAVGIVTKGLGVGANIQSLTALNLAGPDNTPVIACNIGPYSGSPVTAIDLITNGTSQLSIDFP